MKKIFILFLMISLSGIAQQGSKNFIDQNYIEVTGTVESQIIPDEIYISITINEKDKKGKLSVEAQEAKMIQQLKLASIDTEKKLSVENFNSVFNKFFLKKDGVLKVKQYILLVNTTQELTKAFKIFDRLEISNVYIKKVDHSNMEALKLEAKVKAIKIAKKKAKAYAEAIEQTVGKALFIGETSNYISNALAGSANGLMIRGVNSIAKGYVSKSELMYKIAFKKITISASVEAKFELQ